MPINTRELRGKKRLQPSAKPVDTYHRAAPQAVQGPPIGPNGLIQLAGALKGFNASLGGLFDSTKGDNDDQTKLDALKYAYGVPDSELQDAINKNKDLPAGVYRATVQADFGQRLAESTVQDGLRRLNGENTAPEGQPNNAFDRDNGDVNQFWQDLIDNGLNNSTLGQSPEAGITFQKLMEQGRGVAINEQQKYVEGKYRESALTGAFSDMYNTIDNAELSGVKDTKEIHTRIRSLYPTFKKQLKLTQRDMDDLTVQLADQMAKEGRSGIVKELLLGTRDGVGALGKKKHFAKQSVGILKLAEKNRIDFVKAANKDLIAQFDVNADDGTLDNLDEFSKFNEQFPDVLTQKEKDDYHNRNESSQFKARQELETFDRDLKVIRASEVEQKDIDKRLKDMGDEGGLQRLPEKMTYTDDKGKEKTYSRKDLETREILNHLAHSDKLATLNKETPDQKVSRDIKWFTSNGLVNPEWKGALNSAYAGANVESLTDDEVPENLSEGVELYRMLRAKSPLALKQHLKSDEARQFFDLYTTAFELGHNDERKALALATGAMKNINSKDYVPRVSIKDAEKLIKKPDGFWHGHPQNKGQVTKDTLKLANLYTHLGMDTTTALERAAEVTLEDYSQINGRYVKTGSIAVLAFPGLVESKSKSKGVKAVNARSFSESFQGYADDLVKDDLNGVEGTDLTLWPMTNSEGSFMIITRDGVPFYTSNGSKLSTIITVNQLAEFEAGKTKIRVDEAAKVAADKADKKKNEGGLVGSRQQVIENAIESGKMKIQTEGALGEGKGIDSLLLKDSGSKVIDGT